MSRSLASASDSPMAPAWVTGTRTVRPGTAPASRRPSWPRPAAPAAVGPTLEVVVQWEHHGVPESSVRLDLAGLRAAAEQEDVLWDAPPPPREDEAFGWFGYAAMTGEAYRPDPDGPPD